RVSARGEAGGRAASSFSRPDRPVKAVVVRATPPPAPLPFERKAELIRANRGAPVTPAAEARVEAQEPRARARIPVRPVTASPGGMKLNPRSPSAETRPSRPVTPVTPAPSGETSPGRARGRDRSTDATAE